MPHTDGWHRSLILWAMLWEIVGQLQLTILLPPLSRVLVRMVEIVPTPTFLSALWMTGYAFVVGNVIAIVVGVPLGILMGRSVHRRPHLPALGQSLPLARR